MNVYDSERMADSLEKTHNLVSDPRLADAILLNTCHIREKAAEKVYSEVGKFSSLKNKNQKLKIIVAGCVAQAEGKAMLRRQPIIDAIIGPQAYQVLPKVLSLKSDKNKIFLEFQEEEKFSKLGHNRNKALLSSFITIQEGCDKFCSFCVVPFTRGAEYSRYADDIINEAKILSKKGCREIILLGQNVNAYYGKDRYGKKINLADLIQSLEKIESLERISYTTSHPADMSLDLIDLHRTSKKLNPYLHLPVQSGSDSILKNMNRKYSVKDYLSIIDKIRKKVPNIALSSDFIVGFPGETKKDFHNTLQLVQEVKFAHAYSFKYSKRIGTKADRIECKLSEHEKDERLQILQGLLNEQKKDFNKSFIGRELDILYKGKGKKNNQFRGTTRWMQTVVFDGRKEDLKNVFKVKINGAFDNCLMGELV